MCDWFRAWLQVCNIQRRLEIAVGAVHQNGAWNYSFKIEKSEKRKHTRKERTQKNNHKKKKSFIQTLDDVHPKGERANPQRFTRNQRVIFRALSILLQLQEGRQRAPSSMNHKESSWRQSRMNQLLQLDQSLFQIGTIRTIRQQRITFFFFERKSETQKALHQRTDSLRGSLSSLSQHVLHRLSIRHQFSLPNPIPNHRFQLFIELRRQNKTPSFAANSCNRNLVGTPHFQFSVPSNKL